MYAYNRRTGKQCGLRVDDEALLVKNIDFRILATARYTVSTTPTNHNLNSSTRRVFITIDGTAYIDFDKTSPSSTTAPVILTDAGAWLPVEGIKVLNLMGAPGTVVGLVEYG